ncbi:hypothetical protein [Helicobacter mastomyrinus]|uniref:Uncharacterized protein n=2 Tax=Helicobacter TaxID=209 RepID=A0ABZ3F8G1_9HELI|nr:hypothetical protein [uncultured Helicobacter sp.]
MNIATMQTPITFYIAIVICVLGWIFVGLGVLLFPLSIFLLIRSPYRPSFFVFLVIICIMGFTLSLYVDSQYFMKQIF